MGAGDSVTVFDEPVFGEEGYVPRPPPVFDGVGGLPQGWSGLSTSRRGKTHRGAMSDSAAAVPAEKGGWTICPVKNGMVCTSKQVEGAVFSDLVSAIVAAEMMWPRR